MHGCIPKYVGCNSLVLETVTQNSLKKIISESLGYFKEPFGLKNAKEINFFYKNRQIYNNYQNCIGIINISFESVSQHGAPSFFSHERDKIQKLEYELKTARETAEISNLAKTQFLENMKHDIRTPLSGIIGLAELIQYEGDPKKIHSYIASLVKSGRELLEFLNNILDTINISTGDLPLVKKRFNLKVILENVIQLHQAKAIEKNIDLHLSFNDDLPKVFLGDPVRLYRIALEILGNALKFTQQGHIRISAKKIRTIKQTAIIQIEIEDTGPGVNEEMQQELFIRFKRMIPSYRGIYKGMGLGLSIVKQFIDDLEGEIYYYAGKEGGSVFSLLIPLKISLSSLS